LYERGVRREEEDELGRSGTAPIQKRKSFSKNGYRGLNEKMSGNAVKLGGQREGGPKARADAVGLRGVKSIQDDPMKASIHAWEVFMWTAGV